MATTKLVERKAFVGRVKEILIKLVALAIPTFAMSYFKISKALCSELERIVANFEGDQNKVERKIYWVG